MEAIIIVIFSFILLSCILAGYSIIWALLFGYLMFFGYALRQGHTPVQGTDNVRTRNPHDQKYPLHLLSLSV